jgi:transposase
MNESKNLKEKRIERLIYFIESNPDPREMKRALAVKLALQGYVYSAIENILNVSPAFVSKWKQNFEEKGIEGLRLGYKGAKKN